MTTVGLYEARTRLSELLDHVARGKAFLIKRRGKPAAVLAPLTRKERRDGGHHGVCPMRRTVGASSTLAVLPPLCYVF
jgi:prevent-host-death family protein